MNIEEMSTEQIEQYLTQKKQTENTTSPTGGATGIQNPADFDLHKMFTDKANEASYVDDAGNTQSYNKGAKFDKYMNDKLPPNVQQEMFGMIQSLYQQKKAKGYELNKHDLRSIEAQLIAKYGKKFDISGKMLDSTATKYLNELLKDQPAAEQTQTQQPEQTQAPETAANDTKPEPPQMDEPPADTAPEKPQGKQVGNSNSAVAAAQPGDYIVRKDGSTHVLTAGDIEWAKKKSIKTDNVAPSTGDRNTEIEKPYASSVPEADRDALWAEARKKYPDNYEQQQNWVENQLTQKKKKPAEKKPPKPVASADKIAQAKADIASGADTYGD